MHVQRSAAGAPWVELEEEEHWAEHGDNFQIKYKERS
jgi:hypothetical protein